ncbi:bombyxin B-1 homolog isoform X2 [Dermacentor silvarum]|uniref:bombyxin B-1 homolog isoform X2 n=1 Tax=Dermacentor silvarum TaxID=543639 RepID=UPI00189B4AA7|nr:bombyxin B-1 homolog isoform X2 [Dermacentor silvarum]XP_049512511.1 bombyxin B-1 homolog isoform X2 [Dermacentor silvarum]
MTRTTLLLLVVLVLPLLANASGAAQTPSQRRCGRVLREFMEFVCDGVIYDPYESAAPKRALFGQRFLMSGEKSPALGFLRPETANQLLGKRNPQGGIVFECCYKACSIAEAQSYCPS